MLKAISSTSGGGGGGGVTSFTGDGVLLNNSASTGAVTATTVNAPANSVLGNNTGSGTAPAYQTSIAISGTMASAATTITSNSATALVVGANGATNPALTVAANAASAATGVVIGAAAAGSGVFFNATSSGTNEDFIISSKGSGKMSISSVSGNVSLQHSSTDVFSLTNGGVTTNLVPSVASGITQARYGYTGRADTGLTISTEASSIYYNSGQIRQHATGALTLQRDFRITASTHSFVGASTLTTAAAFSVDGPPSGGTNATLANSSAIYVPTSVLANTTNGYGLNITASSGATNNYAALLIGQVVNGGTTPAAAGGTGGANATPTVVGCNNGGTITVITGAVPSTSGVVGTITYTNPFPAGSSVVLFPANGSTALLSGTSMVFATGSTSTFVITAGTVALTGVTTYVWNYSVTGY